MQNCLNEDAAHFYKQFKKYPWIFVMLLLFIISGIVLLTVSLLCNIKFPCRDDQQNYSLFFGLNMCLVSAIFIGLPCLIRGILNCIWYEQPILPVIVTTRSPLSSRQSPPKNRSPQRSRSNSKEKTPPSPKGPIPLHGMKSFKEYHSDA